MIASEPRMVMNTAISSSVSPGAVPNSNNNGMEAFLSTRMRPSTGHVQDDAPLPNDQAGDDHAQVPLPRSPEAVL
jgi:hypothetical protein